MGRLFALPTSELYPFPRSPREKCHRPNGSGPSEQEIRDPEWKKEAPEPPDPPLDRSTVKSYMREHSQKGTKMGKSRQPFVGNIERFVSPDDPEVEFYVKRCGVRENIQRQDMSSSVRYIQRAGSEEFVTEKDYPVGTTKANTILLALSKWNIEDSEGKPVAINYDNLVGVEGNLGGYVSPAEFDFLYEMVLQVNPIWAGTVEARKNSSEPSSTPS